MDAVTLRQYETLSPFEIKNDLAKVAAKTAKASQVAYLNAGRGNPELDCDRAALRVLPARPVRHHREPAHDAAACRHRRNGEGARHRGTPRRAGSRRTPTCPAPRSSATSCRGRSTTFGFSSRTRSCTSWSTRSSATTIRCPTACSCTTSESSASTCSGRCAAIPRPAGTFDLYAVEGGTAAMCYIFKSLKANRLLNPGDTIAMVTPIFTPYLEMPHLEDYGLHMIVIPGAPGAALAVHRRRSGAAARSGGEGVLRRQSRKPVRGGPQPRIDCRDRPRARESAPTSCC